MADSGNHQRCLPPLASIMAQPDPFEGPDHGWRLPAPSATRPPVGSTPPELNRHLMKAAGQLERPTGWMGNSVREPPVLV